MSKALELLLARLRSGNFPAMACIVLLGVVAYGHTLNAPWYLDDSSSILENTAVHRLGDALTHWRSSRWLANLTFALNYSLGGTEVLGYHVANIAIHLVTSCLVFLLLKRVFTGRPLLALGAALIFVAHPLQTQAVTYIVQRTASLAGLFFFLAAYFYVRAREADAVQGPRRRHWLFYALALLSGAVAVLTKQNTAILPVALLLFDRYFLPPGQSLPWRRLVPYLAPFCLLPLLLASKNLLLPVFSDGGIVNLGAMPDLVHLRNNTPLNYLVTQFSVLWLYLRLLFLPYGQALEYDIPIVTVIWEWRNVVAFLGLALLLAAAALLRNRRPLLSFAIFWFFLGLSIESSIIPLDPVFEHRLYVPMFGFALLVMDLLSRLPRRAAMAATVLVVSVLSVLTWQRNALWNNPVAFYEDNVKRAPRNERVHLDLGNRYMGLGRTQEAQALYERALQINPRYVLTHVNLSRVYVSQGEYSKAAALLQEALRYDVTRFELYNNLGVVYGHLGDYDAALRVLHKGAVLEPENATVHLNIARNYSKLNLVDKAIFHYRRSIALDDREPLTHFHLGLALHGRGDLQGALQEFLTTSRLDPNHIGTLYNAALINIQLGDLDSARHLTAQMERLDPEGARQLAIRINDAARGGG